jgi:large subunit ribosomal protein L10
MPNTKNIDQVKSINQKLDQAKNVVLLDYKGLDVAAQTELRAKVVEAGGEFTVQKNTLIKIALTEKAGDLPQTITDALNGPTAVLYGYEDPVSATKAVVDFTKTNEALQIKAGVLTAEAGQPWSFLSLDQIKNLASLPSKDELRARVVGQLQAPIAGFVNVMAGNIRGLVNVLNAVKDQKTTN